jgi:LemA protein
MPAMTNSTLFIILLIASASVWAFVAYQRLSQCRDRIDHAFGEIDVHLKQRHEFTPRLLDFLAAHQFVDANLTSTLLQARNTMANAAVKIRTFSNDAPSIDSLANANTAYANALNRVLVTASACPAIRSDTTFNTLMGEVKNTEDAIGIKRQLYNDTVTVYNNQCAAFPALLIAALLGFRCAGILRAATPSKAGTSSVSAGTPALR